MSLDAGSSVASRVTPSIWLRASFCLSCCQAWQPCTLLFCRCVGDNRTPQRRTSSARPKHGATVRQSWLRRGLAGEEERVSLASACREPRLSRGRLKPGLKNSQRKGGALEICGRNIFSGAYTREALSDVQACKFVSSVPERAMERITIGQDDAMFQNQGPQCPSPIICDYPDVVDCTHYRCFLQEACLLRPTGNA